MEPQRPSRVMWVKDERPQELSWKEFLNQFKAGDLIVVNDTKVMPSRVWAEPMGQDSPAEVDLLFTKSLGDGRWEVLAPTKKMKNQKWILPDGVEIVELQPGIPQTVQLSREIDDAYFFKFGEVPLPPYILKSRGDRHSHTDDSEWYQTFFAKTPGSCAAPTASLHFTAGDFDFLKSRGVEIAHLTLHVGLGTFLPVTVDNLNDHKMHSEFVHIPKETWRKVGQSSGRVWALGTTVARALESAVIGKLKKTEDGFIGNTDLLILPGYDFKMVRGLLTNFHQPESTLLALVSAYAGLENLKRAYAWAVDKKFRLFSYGDLSVWEM